MIIEKSTSLEVLLVEDSPQISEKLIELLNELSNISAIFVSETLLQALNTIRDLQPTVVILDIHLNNEDGLELVRNKAKLQPCPIFIIISNSPELRKTALDLGADYFLDKTFEISSLHQIFREITFNK